MGVSRIRATAAVQGSKDREIYNMSEISKSETSKSKTVNNHIDTTGARALRYIKLSALAAAAVGMLVIMTGCGGVKTAQYTVTAEGAAAESGVIEYAGLEMNVYKDKASNPCGDCPDQPVSIYAGTSAEDTISAMAEAVERADDVWHVSSVDGNVLILTEKTPGTIKEGEEEPELSAPEGLKLTGKLEFVKIKAAAGSADSSKNKSDDNGGAAASGSSDSAKREITNVDGSKIEVPEKAERIAAVYGPSYEAAVILGAEERIVVCADVQYENFPWALKIFKRMKDLPHLNNVHSSVNFEELQKYSPDLVLTFNRPNELKQLRKAGISAINAVTPQTLQESIDFLDVYAEALGGDAPARAQKYRAYFNKKLDRIRSVTDTLDESERPSVYYAGIDILTTYGKYSDIREVIEAAGGRCVTADLDAGNHTQINFEQLAAWDPEYVFIDHGGMNDRSTVEQIKDSTERNSRYKAIKAVKNGNIYLTPSGVFYWDMGLQKILLVMDMAKTLHPEKFADLDMNAEVREFYSTFFDYDLSEKEAAQILAREDPS